MIAQGDIIMSSSGNGSVKEILNDTLHKNKIPYNTIGLYKELTEKFKINFNNTQGKENNNTGLLMNTTNGVSSVISKILTKGKKETNETNSVKNNEAKENVTEVKATQTENNTKEESVTSQVNPLENIIMQINTTEINDIQNVTLKQNSTVENLLKDKIDSIEEKKVNMTITGPIPKNAAKSVEELLVSDQSRQIETLRVPEKRKGNRRRILQRTRRLNNNVKPQKLKHPLKRRYKPSKTGTNGLKESRNYQRNNTAYAILPLNSNGKRYTTIRRPNKKGRNMETQKAQGSTSKQKYQYLNSDLSLYDYIKGLHEKDNLKPLKGTSFEFPNLNHQNFNFINFGENYDTNEIINKDYEDKNVDAGPQEIVDVHDEHEMDHEYVPVGVEEVHNNQDYDDESNTEDGENEESKSEEVHELSEEENVDANQNGNEDEMEHRANEDEDTYVDNEENDNTDNKDYEDERENDEEEEEEEEKEELVSSRMRPVTSDYVDALSATLNPSDIYADKLMNQFKHIPTTQVSLITPDEYGAQIDNTKQAFMQHPMAGQGSTKGFNHDFKAQRNTNKIKGSSGVQPPNRFNTVGKFNRTLLRQPPSGTVGTIPQPPINPSGFGGYKPHVAPLVSYSEPEYNIRFRHNPVIEETKQQSQINEEEEFNNPEQKESLDETVLKEDDQQEEYPEVEHYADYDDDKQRNVPEPINTNSHTNNQDSPDYNNHQVTSSNNAATTNRGNNMNYAPNQNCLNSYNPDSVQHATINGRPYDNRYYSNLPNEDLNHKNLLRPAMSYHEERRPFKNEERPFTHGYEELALRSRDPEDTKSYQTDNNQYISTRNKVKVMQPINDENKHKENPNSDYILNTEDGKLLYDYDTIQSTIHPAYYTKRPKFKEQIRQYSQHLHTENGIPIKMAYHEKNNFNNHRHHVKSNDEYVNEDTNYPHGKPNIQSEQTFKEPYYEENVDYFDNSNPNPTEEPHRNVYPTLSINSLNQGVMNSHVQNGEILRRPYNNQGKLFVQSYPKPEEEEMNKNINYMINITNGEPNSYETKYHINHNNNNRPHRFSNHNITRNYNDPISYSTEREQFISRKNKNDFYSYPLNTENKFKPNIDPRTDYQYTTHPTNIEFSNKYLEQDLNPPFYKNNEDEYQRKGKVIFENDDIPKLNRPNADVSYMNGKRNYNLQTKKENGVADKTYKIHGLYNPTTSQQNVNQPANEHLVYTNLNNEEDYTEDTLNKKDDSPQDYLTDKSGEKRIMQKQGSGRVTMSKQALVETLNDILDKKDAISRVHDIDTKKNEPKSYSNYWVLEYSMPTVK